MAKMVEGVDFTEVAIVSGVKLESGEGPAGAVRVEDIPGVAVEPTLASGEKCQRCWQVLEEVKGHADRICRRCDIAVSSLEA